ncbi:MFS transporter [Agrilactobacillus fermenti]|uniref:MFS transporter n=1 Tax=Agrilactobacillus fermenti TaxID=2586909 RepID=UPI003A5BF63A
MIMITNRQSVRQICKDVVSNLLSSFSGDMFAFAMGLMLLNETGLALSFGLSMVITPIVNLLGFVPIGNLVDQQPHRRLMIIFSLVRLLALLGYALVITKFTGRAKILPTIIFLVINAWSTTVNTTAYTAAVQELVNARHIQSLQSLTQAAATFASLFAPIAATVLYDWIGFKGFILLEFAANVGAFLLLLSMKFFDNTPTLTTNPGPRSRYKQFLSGTNFIRQNKFLLLIVSLAILINFFYAALTVGLPYAVIQVDHYGKAALAFLNTLIAVGLCIGNLSLNFLPKIKRLSPILLVNTIVLGISYMALFTVLVLKLSRPLFYGLGGLVMFLIGLTLAFLNTPLMVYFQEHVPKNLLGRVAVTFTTAVQTSMPLGALLFSSLFQLPHSQWLFLGCGGCIIAVAVASSKSAILSEHDLS